MRPQKAKTTGESDLFRARLLTRNIAGCELRQSYLRIAKSSAMMASLRSPMPSRSSAAIANCDCCAAGSGGSSATSAARLPSSAPSAQAHLRFVRRRGVRALGL